MLNWPRNSAHRWETIDVDCELVSSQREQAAQLPTKTMGRLYLELGRTRLEGEGSKGMTGVLGSLITQRSRLTK
ncbi:unnamed protein product [Soboliphyme baturini]|uniref:Transposase n=1 Tax=Soboliphyme baturini TaxID=241478 RepID=A0A183J574_9BILA|nr:unnamed protein product [Soboliphyme baturini]